jgi:threonine aldolase
MQKIDLRSDTVTMPSENMLKAMMNAEAGDMVLNEDFSVNALEEKAASMFNMEAAAFCPSGTMTNQIAIKVHTRPGDEVICSKLAHIYLFEGGGIAFNSGSSVALIDSPDGTFNAGQVLENINPDDPHKAHTSLVSIENTVNRGGGKIWDFTEILKIKEVCKSHNLKLHLDGARIFNAIIETGNKPSDFGSVFDSISICLSKGLGAPVGSLLLGSAEYIYHAKRMRKVMGGTMRQAGYIAAAGIYALDNNINRLRDDHKHAEMIKNAISDRSWVKEILPVETNIIIFKTVGDYKAPKIKELLAGKNILISAIDNEWVRMVTHLNVTSEMVDYVCEEIRQVE